jgi:lipid-binding SYLF domain-containing protein
MVYGLPDIATTTQGDSSMQRRLMFQSLLPLAGAFLFATSGPALAETVAEQKAEIQKMRSATLARLYKVHPAAKADVQKAAGYAVFSNVGINLILLSAAGGSGVAHDNGSGQDIYMKMVSGGFGIGLGVKDFRGVFVFSTTEKLKQFTESGWEASAQADAAAKAGDKGGAAAGAITVAPGVKLYQLTENGLALQATIQGTKYFKNDDLNGR